MLDAAGEFCLSLCLMRERVGKDDGSVGGAVSNNNTADSNIATATLCYIIILGNIIIMMNTIVLWLGDNHDDVH